jgi:hypothetical protein
MTPAGFKQSLKSSVPPRALPPPLQALWWVRKGDWEKAHRIVMNENSRAAAWVHAYLHRLEGDDANARYWYTRARRPAARSSLDEEWEEILDALI